MSKVIQIYASDETKLQLQGLAMAYNTSMADIVKRLVDDVYKCQRTVNINVSVLPHPTDAQPVPVIEVQE